jgi:adenine/guanine phosphoribosyltransferase-like PRPP-binding protein
MGEGRMVLLVDDVMISGDPVEACAKSLAKSGALHVDVFWRGLSAPPLGPYSMETFV